MKCFVTSVGLTADKMLPVAIKLPTVRYRWFRQIGNDDVILGWGNKASGHKARYLSKVQGNKYLSCEEALYSYPYGKSTGVRCGYVLDDIGPYYDANIETSFEQTLSAAEEIKSSDIEVASKCIRLIRQEHLTKYQSVSGLSCHLSSFVSKFKKNIMLADQVYGDMSVDCGWGGAKSFSEMLDEAKNLPPDIGVIIKVHPDVINGFKEGYLRIDSLPKNFFLASADIDVFSIFDVVSEVWVVTSQIGFDAIIAGKKVRCWGMPFYAGWGITEDEKSHPRRGVKRSLVEVFAVLCIQCSVYANPLNQSACSLYTLLLIQSDFHGKKKRFGYINKALCVGFSLWKRAFISKIIAPFAASPPVFLSSYDNALQRYSQGDVIFGWGEKAERFLASNTLIRVVMLEDGFIRSNGLGSDLRRPSSLCFDNKGNHFSRYSASELRQYLTLHCFSDSDKERGSLVRAKIIKAGISKYNLSGSSVNFKSVSRGMKVILVIGQVPGDQSIRLGAGSVKSNRELLSRVRELNDDAYIIYKPHPDVIVNNREDNFTMAEAFSIADEIVTSVCVNKCIDSVDEVHVITSTTGLEALVRGKTVVTYGHPFYAGYGLTIDHEAIASGRLLTVDELVFAAFVWYPLYFEWSSGNISSVEDCIDELSRGSVEKGFKWLRKAKYLVEALC